MRTKNISLLLALTLLLTALAGVAGPAAQASHADDFLSNLGKTWDSLVGMAGDAGQAISDWAVDSGVVGWVEGAVDSVSQWAEETGLSGWAQGALDDVSQWAEDIGVTDWARQIAADTQALIDQNRPAVEAWLAQAGEDVTRAWNTLVNADAHTHEEVQQAYDTVVESLEEAEQAD